MVGMELREALLYEKLSDNKVRCHLCAHRCVIFDGHMGICRVRQNRGGTLYTLVYGRTISQYVDPVEKKPLFHFHPGSTAYSIATPGCNFRCRWCQNWEISQLPREQRVISGRRATPEQIVAGAQRAGCRSIAYTYTEPTIFFEYAYDPARLAHAAGLANIYVTNVPSDAEAFSAVAATVEDAVRLGADAVGYTLYLGSPAQDRDFIQLGQVRKECDHYAMPLIVWSYPRGSAVEATGGRDSIYAVNYAARVANELGADIVKLNVPKFWDARNEDSPPPYRELYEAWKKLDEDAAYRQTVEKVVASAGKTMVLFSGGSRISDEDLLLKARICVEAGATGLIFGRNMWQRPFEEGLRITDEIKQILLSS
jgi:DhnA family fructose-bisphosphate aldolase class Ia